MAVIITKHYLWKIMRVMSYFYYFFIIFSNGNNGNGGDDGSRYYTLLPRYINMNSGSVCLVRRVTSGAYKLPSVLLPLFLLFFFTMLGKGRKEMYKQGIHMNHVCCLVLGSR